MTEKADYWQLGSKKLTEQDMFTGHMYTNEALIQMKKLITGKLDPKS